ncbi:MAG TPA: hypothetical protein VI233_10340, partial [Puia sp.]
MLPYKKISIVAGLFTLMIIGMAAVRPEQEAPKHKMNLKVLPRNISHEELGKVMDAWKNALGVKCNFCHAPSAD